MLNVCMFVIYTKEIKVYNLPHFQWFFTIPHKLWDKYTVITVDTLSLGFKVT